MGNLLLRRMSMNQQIRGSCNGNGVNLDQARKWKNRDRKQETHDKKQEEENNSNCAEQQLGNANNMNTALQCLWHFTK